MKQLTIRYWKSLSKDSQRRALTCVFPLHKGIVEMLLNDEPVKSDPWWQIVFRKVKVPDGHSHYKTIINKTWIP